MVPCYYVRADTSVEAPLGSDGSNDYLFRTYEVGLNKPLVCHNINCMLYDTKLSYAKQCSI